MARKFTFLVILCSLLFLNEILAQKPDLRFKSISANQGLSNSTVSCITQDYQGFMWFGTLNGLNRYDGYKTKVYHHDPGDSTSLSHNEVVWMEKDSKGDIWLGLYNGVAKYNREKDYFINYKALEGLYIRQIYTDRNGGIWVLYNEYLYRYNEKNDSFYKYDSLRNGEYAERIYQDKSGSFYLATFDRVYPYDVQKRQLDKSSAINIKDVRAFYQDEKGLLWMGSTSEGLFKYDISKSELIKITEKGLADAPVMYIREDHKNRLWIGTMNKGLYIIDSDRKNIYNYSYDKGDTESLSFNTVSSIYEDQNNNMWLGTHKKGINFIEERRFSYYQANPYWSNSLSNDNVTCFYEAHNGKVWIGTDGGGLNIFDKKKDDFKVYKNDPEDPYSLASDVILDIFEDHNGTIWLAHWMGGISQYDEQNDRFISYKISDQQEDAIWRDDCIIRIYEDADFNLWVATHDELTLFDRTNKRYVSLDNDSLGYFTSSILQKDPNELWIGTYEGLILYNVANNYTRFYRHKENDSTSLSNSVINVLYRDSEGRLWIGTGAGLNLADEKRMTFQKFGLKEGFSSETITSIAEDDQKNLWLGTNNGLVKFNPENHSVINYNVFDGLQGNEFKIQSCLRLSTGELLFGGTDGFNMFHPEKIPKNTSSPNIVLTDFKIFNQSVEIGGAHSVLPRSINVIDKIELPYSKSVFTFEFAALNYLIPEQNQYAYMMEGFDKGWIFTGNNRTATYTNLDPGTYTFKVKASNNDGVWNDEGKSVKIVIQAPFYMTWWFRVLIGIALILFIWNVFRINAMGKQRRVLKTQVDERTKELAIQTDNLKIANKEITDSIKAAEAIQKSILPSEAVIKTYLTDAFIFFQPKDIIGGDFYWFEKIGDKLIIAAVDCTGHGVGGALMAINGHHLLNQIIHSGVALKCSDILEELNNAVTKSLHQENNAPENQDGMDISLVIIDIKTNKLQFSGANLPLYMVRNGKLKELSPSRFPIGFNSDHIRRTFVNNELELQKNDMLYLFSDGFVDQIGGEMGYEKFMYPRFRELFMEISDFNTSQQQQIIAKTFHDWKGNVDQLDDTMILGLRV